MTMSALADTQITIQRQEIIIDLVGQGLSIKEHLTYENAAAGNLTLLTFSIPLGASQIEIITISGDSFLIYPIDDTSYEINLSENNILFTQSDNIVLQLSYFLPTNTETFQKTILYDTTYLSVEFNDRTIYQGENLLFNENIKNSLFLTLYRPTEAPFNLTTLIIIFSLVVIVILIMLILVRKNRKPAVSTEGESQELLTTKKALYLAMLKDIEKQHRGKQISDETYTKLKSEYKQHAVIVMQKLQNIMEKK
jgi:hypothetical protein